MAKEKSENYLISIVDKALDVMLALRNREGKSIRELGSELGISKSTLYRILRTLELKDFVRQDSTTEKYSLGIKIFELGTKIKYTFEIRNIAFPYMEKLGNDSGETVQLACLDNNTVLMLESVEGIGLLRVFSTAGQRFPITYGNFGKVFLSQLPEEEVLDFIKQQPLKKYATNSVTNLELYLQKLKEVRINGLSFGIDDPIEGTFSFVAPVYDQKNSVVACISLTGPKTAENIKKLKQHESAIRKTARLISKELGFKG